MHQTSSQNQNQNKNPDILELNVSGVTEGFCVRRKLLCSVDGSKIKTYFDLENKSKLEIVNNRIFIDRDPAMFRYVLMYLRCDQQMPQLDLPFEKKMFSKELEYWGLPEYD